MLRIAVCDDEPICLENEKRIIENYLSGRNEKSIIDTFTSAQELLVAASEIQYDLFMLDVEMPGIDGMKVAGRLHEIDDKIPLVFISAYMKYASDGYHVNAFRYILKDENIEIYIAECLERILKNIGIDNRKVLLDFTVGKREIHVNEIVCIKRQRNYTVFETTRNDKESLMQKRPVKRVREIMAQFEFISVSSGVSVNPYHITEVNGEKVYMDNGEKFSIPRRKHDEFMSAYRLYIRGKKL